MPRRKAPGSPAVRLALLKSQRLDALFVLGDNANGGDQASMIEAVHAVSGAGVPTWIVAGNVDLRRSQSALEDALAATNADLEIPTLAGEALGGFTVAGLRFQGVSDDLIGLDQRPDIAALDIETVLLVSHYPVISRETEALAGGWRYSGDALGLDNLAAELATRGAPTIVFHGHLHLKDAIARGSLLQLGFPALIEQGHQVTVVEIESWSGTTRLTIATFSAGDAQRPSAAIETPSAQWVFEAERWRPAPAG